MCRVDLKVFNTKMKLWNKQTNAKEKMVYPRLSCIMNIFDKKLFFETMKHV